MASAGRATVVCRVRPQNELEEKNEGQKCMQFTKESVKIQVPGMMDHHDFTFDRVFPPNSKQTEVYDDAARPVVEAVMRGYNGTIFAYGQTSSGKTYTMEGPDRTSPEARGIIPRTMGTLFEGVASAPETLEFEIAVSYLEIYMERINDLLDVSKTNLSVKESKDKGIWVPTATRVHVSTVEEMMACLNEGATNRSVAETRMNERSSRSHSVFVIFVTQTDTTTDSTKTGKLCLVDLAGSEKVQKTWATGQQLEEAKLINQSLSALGNVINALTDSKASHIPYRNSKLTRILQESLGGNAQTTLIINCTESSYNEDETLSTLRFGVRAKNIQNKPIVNEQRSIKTVELELEKAKREIEMQKRVITQLKAEVEQPQSSGGQSEGDTEALKSLKSKCLRLMEIQQRMQASIEGYEADVARLSSIVEDKDEALVHASKQAAALKAENEEVKNEVRAKDDRIAELESELIKTEAKAGHLQFQMDEKSLQADVSLNRATAQTKQTDWQEKEERLKDDLAKSQKKVEELDHEFDIENVKIVSTEEPADGPCAKVKEGAVTRNSVGDTTNVTVTIRSSKDTTSGGTASDGHRESASDVELLLESIAEYEVIVDTLEKEKNGWEERERKLVAKHNTLKSEVDELRVSLNRSASDLVDLRDTFIGDLQNRCEKVIELEMQNANLKSALKNVGARGGAVANAKELQERMEELTLKCTMLTDERAALVTDLAFRDKRIELGEKRIASLEDLVEILAEKIRDLRARAPDTPDNDSTFVTLMQKSKISKKMKGGQHAEAGKGPTVGESDDDDDDDGGGDDGDDGDDHADADVSGDSGVIDGLGACGEL